MSQSEVDSSRKADAGHLRVDVAILGGGPAGSTAGCLLKKYHPALRVAIFEKEQFPRDHVGESLIPAVTTILNEMGVWDKVEEADFPIKLGATYRWGATNDLWYLNFIPESGFKETHRPGKFESQRTQTAFQVDRSIYDHILLEHAEEVGCEVWMNTTVRGIHSAGGRVVKLRVQEKSGREMTVKARYYVDATGEAGVLRRALGVAVETPTTLKNIAFWDYWVHAEWPERFSGTATRIQVLSLGWGWLWFIPITQTRTSVGLVLPADHFKKSGSRPEDMYLEAINAEPLVANLISHATREGRFATTKDCNYLASHLVGSNWFLTGDSCGFADPILSAGLTLAQTSARKVAYTILELYRGGLDSDWLKGEYEESHRGQILQHMRFAEFWYAGNGCFTDLKEYCSTLASDSGLNLEPDEAFAWLGSGGFALDRPGFAGALGFPLSGLRLVTQNLTGGTVKSAVHGCNCVQANLRGVEHLPYAIYEGGRIIQAASYRRNGSVLPRVALFELLLRTARDPIYIDAWLAACYKAGRRMGPEMSQFTYYLDAVEALVREGWLTASYRSSMPSSAIFSSDSLDRESFEPSGPQQSLTNS